MIRSMVPGGLLAALLLATPASAAVNLIVNGGFEEPRIFQNSSFEPLPGWSESGFLGTIFPYEGHQYLLMPRIGSIAQSVSLTAGQIYEFSFAYRNLTGASGVILLQELVFGTVYTNFTVPSTSHAGVDWQEFSFRFTALQSPTFLSINSLSRAEFHVDGFSLTAVSPAVPEPATWAMMLIGFAGLGVAARRRERAAAG